MFSFNFLNDLQITIDRVQANAWNSFNTLWGSLLRYQMTRTENGLCPMPYCSCQTHDNDIHQHMERRFGRTRTIIDGRTPRTNLPFVANGVCVICLLVIQIPIIFRLLAMLWRIVVFLTTVMPDKLSWLDKVLNFLRRR
jgi:hypothetical protein